MAVLFSDASSEYLQINTAFDVTPPLTFCARFRSNDNNNNGTLLAVAKRTATNQLFMLQAVGTFAGDPIRAFAFDGTPASAITTTGFTVGQWHHACAVFESTTSRRCYIDGGSKGTNTASIAPAIDSSRGTSIGRTCDSTPSGYMSGDIAEVSIHRYAFTDANAAQAAAGRDVRTIRPDTLLSYWRLRNLNDLMDVWGHTGSMSAFNTPVASDHPPTRYASSPRRNQNFSPIAFQRAGRRFLFTEANWGARTWYFEATIRRQSGTAYAKLYDLTDGADVANSQVSTTSVIIVRLRSSAITLVDGHEYEGRIGSLAGDEGRGLGTQIIGVL